MKAWFESAFGADYLQIYAHRDLDEARRDVAGLLEHGLRGRVLDLAAGAGRHLVALREAGLEAAGIDLSAELLGAALGAGLPLVRADSRRPPFRARAFDTALSLFTSFGYHAERAEDLAQLQTWAGLLRPGGSLFVDVPHPAVLRAKLVPESRRRAGELEITERRALEAEGRRVVKNIEVLGPLGSRVYREAVNLYEPDELDAILTAAGLVVEARWGGFRGELFEAASQRQVVRARLLL